jgi:hypothetical protein
VPVSQAQAVGARWDSDRRRFIAPSAATLRRVLIVLVGDGLDARWARG